MAEFVEYRMECALPEYEQMSILNLFTPEEILKMKKARENYIYRVSQPSRSIKDFVEFIKYERNVVGLTRQRTKLQKLNTKHTILTLISNRMKQLYAQALSKFPHNLRFWDEYIKFLQQFKFSKDISSTFDQMLQFHSDKPDVWMRVILWEYNENFNDERVKGLLLRAQQLHPDHEKIYLMFFQIQLENKQQTDETLTLQHANVVYENGKKRLTNITFFIEMLNIVDKFAFAQSIQTTIVQDLRQMFPSDELMWHTLAQRELNMSTVSSKEAERLTAQNSTRKRIQMCLRIYEEAIKKVTTARMWDYYLNATLELNSNMSTESSLKRLALSRAFEQAYQSNHITEKHFLQYIELLYANSSKGEGIENVLQKATKAYAKSANIWLQCIRYYIHQNHFKKVVDTFDAAQSKLGSNGTDIWHLYILYLSPKKSADAKPVYERFILALAQQPNASFNKVKAHVLEIIATSYNMKQARATYKLFIEHFPSCYEVHDKMAELESKRMKRNVKLERKCLDMLILYFGKVRIDVWLRYMRFEQEVGDPKNVSRLHQNAIATLNAELLDDFSASYIKAE